MNLEDGHTFESTGPRGLQCPYCKEHNTQRLEGGSVWECYSCGSAFNKETVSHEDSTR